MATEYMMISRWRHTCVRVRSTEQYDASSSSLGHVLYAATGLTPSYTYTTSMCLSLI